MPGFNNDVLYAGNLDFSGGAVPTAQMVADGQLLIGATGLNPAVATLTSGDGSTTIASGAGTIGLTVTQATEGQLGGAEVATAAETIAYASDALMITPTKLTTAFSSPQPIGDTTPSTGDFTLITGVGAGAGAQNVIDITPAIAIGGVDWRGIDIDGAALDPTAANSSIHALDIDLSGVDQTNDPDLIGVHITMPAIAGQGCDTGITVEGYGITSMLNCSQRGSGFYTDATIEQDADTTAFTAVDSGFSQIVNVNNAGSTGGDFHAYEVTATGVGTADIFALGTNPEIGVIHQHTGVFAATAQSWKENGGFTDVTAAFDNPGVDVTIFDGDNDYIYIGANAVFSQIRVTLNTVSGRDIFPVFEYSTGGPVWVPFTPIDATNGFTEDGIISFTSGDLAGWVAVNVNGGNFFYIRIQRTRNNIVTTPIEDIIRILEPVEYYWNEDGEILISAITGIGANFTTVDAGTFDTNVAAAGLEMSATTISADGTDANIDVSITPKGTGVLLTPAIGNAADTTAIAITATGEVTMPLQPAFLAYLAAGDTDSDVTGNGAAYTFGSGNALTEVFDQNADFNTNGTLTAPVTGRYLLTYKAGFNPMTAGARVKNLQIITSNRTIEYQVDFSAVAGSEQAEISIITDMDAADTATYQLTVSGEVGNTVDILGAADLRNAVSGCLLV